jgi:hypothetical protein
MRPAPLSLLAFLCPLAVVAAPSTQLQLNLAGPVLFGDLSSGPPVSTNVTVGFEDGLGVYQLGFGGSYSRAHRVAGATIFPDGTTVNNYADQRSWFATISPSYRRYLSSFDDGFAPLIEAGVRFGVGHTAFGAPFDSTTSVLYGASVALGGEVRFGEHFALTGKAIADITGTRETSRLKQHQETLSLGSSAGMTLRF